MRYTQSTTGQLRTRKSGGPGGGKVSGEGETITFADVAGVDEAKEELEEIVVGSSVLIDAVVIFVLDLVNFSNTWLNCCRNFSRILIGMSV